MILGIDLTNIKKGGGLTHISELLKVAQPRLYGFEQVIVWGNAETIALLPNFDWLKTAIFPQMQQPFFQFFQRIFFFPNIARKHCDLLFSPGGSFFSTKMAYVSMSQNMLVFEKKERDRFRFHFNWFRYLFLSALQTLSFQQAKGIIFISEYAKHYIGQRLRKDFSDFPVIYHGVADRFSQKPKVINPKATIRLLYISTISFYKHQWNVVEAVAKLREDGFLVNLDLIGDFYPPAWQKLQRSLAKFPASKDFVKVYGAVNFEEIATYYQQADIFVFASTCENMPNILVEAMRAGLPIASSDYGPMPEILGDAAFYFDPLDVNSIYESLKMMLTSPEKCFEKAEKAFVNSQQYSWQRCADETFTFLQKMAKV